MTDSLETIAAEVSACTKCPLHEGRTHAVPGEGNPHADLMFVGEGPGRNEDEQGRPFVGAAGRFLEEMLAAIKLTREDVFIGNVVKCRPPGNRDPEPFEVTTCTEAYLYRQIDLIQPKLICTLGRHAMSLFLPNARISQIHGQPKRLVDSATDKPTHVIFPMYHPAAALYHAPLKQTMMRDFRRIPKVLEKLAA